MEDTGMKNRTDLTLQIDLDPPGSGPTPPGAPPLAGSQPAFSAPPGSANTESGGASRAASALDAHKTVRGAESAPAAGEPDGPLLLTPEYPAVSPGASGKNDPSSPPARLDPDRYEKLLDRLDNSGLGEYVKLSGRTWKVLWLNFLSGIARGLGFTVGTAVVLAIVYKILSNIISMNIPYLTDLLNDLLANINLPPPPK